MGMRKPRVLPVPVLACAMLMKVSHISMALEMLSPYMSTPLRASLIVLVCTSVMVVSLICLVMVLMMLGWTSPRFASSANSVTGPSFEASAVSASAAAICCHFALWWKPAVVALTIREAGIRSALVALKDDTRKAEEEIAAVERLRESVVGHLRNALNMVGV
jgi:hypothetical protein